MSQGQYVVAYSHAQKLQLAFKLAQQKAMHKRLANMIAAKAWNADMAARKAAKGSKP